MVHIRLILGIKAIVLATLEVQVGTKRVVLPTENETLAVASVAKPCALYMGT